SLRINKAGCQGCHWKRNGKVQSFLVRCAETRDGSRVRGDGPFSTVSLCHSSLRSGDLPPPYARQSRSIFPISSVYGRHVLRPDYRLSTERLVLRPFTRDDFDDLYAYHALPEVARYLYWEARDREQARAALEQKTTQTALAEEGQCLVLAVHWPQVDAVVGEVNLRWLSRRHRQGEIGFVFN